MNNSEFNKGIEQALAYVIEQRNWNEELVEDAYIPGLDIVADVLDDIIDALREMKK